MKRIFGILLLLVITFPLVFLYVSYRIETKSIRKEVKEMLFMEVDRNELIELSFYINDAKSLLSWKDEHEFEYLGRMYDIVETSILGDTIKYLCWPDDEETRLNKRLDELVAKALGSEPQKKESSKRLLDFLKIQFFRYNLSDWDGLTDEGIVQYPQLTSLYTSVFIAPASPPPKFSC